MEGGNLTIIDSNFSNIATNGNGGAFYLTNAVDSQYQAFIMIQGNSNFENIQAGTEGGVFYLQNFNLTIENNVTFCKVGFLIL